MGALKAQPTSAGSWPRPRKDRHAVWTCASLHLPGQEVQSFYPILEIPWGPEGLAASVLKDGWAQAGGGEVRERDCVKRRRQERKMKVGARLVRGSESPSRTDKRRRILKSLGQATEPGSPGGGGQAPRAVRGDSGG